MQQLAFDLFMLAMFVLNAFDQPYRRSSEVFKRLRTSGILMYTVRQSANRFIGESLMPYFEDAYGYVRVSKYDY